MENLLITLLSALCYLAFNTALFSAYAAQTDTHPSPWLCFGATFALNFSFFIVISSLQLPLAVNWLLIALLLMGEVRLLYHSPALLSFFLGLSGAVLGMAVTVFSRSLVAIALDVPLLSLDAKWSTPYNARAWAVGFSFLLGALLLRASRPLLAQRNNRYLNYSLRNLRFIIGLTAIQFCYLLLTLLLYSLPANDLILKLWGIKTGLCVLLGYSIGAWYAVRESGLEYFERKAMDARQRLHDYRQREMDLEKQARTDHLTGCPNRAFGKQVLEESIRRGRPFVLCFVDIDGLKAVNDTLGHGEGDRYILVVTQALADVLEDGRDLLSRFGGDEFCLLFHDRTLAEVKSLMKDAAGAIANLSWSAVYPFACSISYGLAEGDGNSDTGAVLRLADAQMYAHKARHYAARA